MGMPVDEFARIVLPQILAEPYGVARLQLKRIHTRQQLIATAYKQL